MRQRIVTVDIGGTHARFAMADVSGGRVVALGDPATMATADHADFDSAWRAFGAGRRDLPRAAAIAAASLTQGRVIRFTNNSWAIDTARLHDDLGIERHVVINDFEAVGHGVAQVDAAYFRWLCGPDVPLPDRGTISVIGPGTGLGVSHVRRDGADYHVQATQGGHGDFAPLDAFEDALLARLRSRYGRVSAERVVSGPAIADIYATLAQIAGRPVQALDDRTIWRLALDGADDIAVAALDRFCLSLGSIAGDLALAQGASAAVIAGGLGLRIADRLAQSGFGDRFVAKGRFRDWMAAIPVKLITHPQPGLLGAAAAFARRYA